MNLKNSNISFAMHFWVGGNTRKCPSILIDVSTKTVPTFLRKKPNQSQG